MPRAARKMSAKMKVSLGVGASVIVIAALLQAFPQWAQEQDDPDVAESAGASGVTEAELELYIEVYSAMQADHDLTIDAALAGRQVPLERFRNIEQRVQREQRLVDRVRQALLDQAKHRSASAAVNKANEPEGKTTPRADDGGAGRR